MSPSGYSESSYQTYETLGSLQPDAIDFDFEAQQLPDQYPPGLSSYHVPAGYFPGTLPAQHTVTHHPVGILEFPTQDGPLWHQSLKVWLIDWFTNAPSTD